MIGLLLLAGCASNPQQPPQIQRISAEELESLLPQPQPNLTLDDVVRLGKEGQAPDAIIDKIRQTGSSYELTPSQVLELSRQGVDAKVLDHIHAAREQVLRDGFADEINKREQACQAELEETKRQMLMRPYWSCDPFWGPYPPYWRHPYFYYRR